MRTSKPRFIRTILTVVGVMAFLSVTAYGRAANPNGGTDGRLPRGRLIMDATGSLYGETMVGGAYYQSAPGNGNGTVFKLTPNGTGGWTESILHSFNGADGGFPQGGVIMDGSGNLYGTTSVNGGAPNHGNVFELSPPTKRTGGWTETVLLGMNGTYGSSPGDALTMDLAGNLYGTAPGGGTSGAGTVFKLTKSSGTWTPSVLYNFLGGLGDGSAPSAGVIMDSSGNLYGTTGKGGTYGAGTVFKLTLNLSTWSESVLYDFEGGTPDGQSPSRLIFGGTSGNLYGPTVSGGTFNAGTVFSLPLSGGNDSILYDFTGGLDGNGPKDGVIADGNGNFFGTTHAGGASGMGTVFELTGATLTTLCTFTGANGNDPEAGLLMDGAGNLYGTTALGGANGEGTVFKLTNNGGTWTESVLYNFM